MPGLDIVKQWKRFCEVCDRPVRWHPVCFRLVHIHNKAQRRRRPIPRMKEPDSARLDQAPQGFGAVKPDTRIDFRQDHPVIRDKHGPARQHFQGKGGFARP